MKNFFTKNSNFRVEVIDLTNLLVDLCNLKHISPAEAKKLFETILSYWKVNIPEIDIEFENQPFTFMIFKAISDEHPSIATKQFNLYKQLFGPQGTSITLSLK